MANVPQALPELRAARSRWPQQKVPKWHALHKNMYNHLKRDWKNDAPSFDEETLLLYPGLSVLSTREIQVLELSAGIESFAAAGCLHAVDVSQSANRTRPMHNITPTVLPGGKVYLSDRCRVMHPIECMRAQGLHFPVAELCQFSECLLQNLAGNAFDVSSCLACIVATCVILAHGCSSGDRGEGTSDSSSPMQVAADDATESGSDSSESLFRTHKRLVSNLELHSSIYPF